MLRPKIQARFPSLTSERVDAFLQALIGFSEVLSSVPTAITFTRDPKDEASLNLAADASAAFLVSRDKDLLELHEPNNPESAAIFQLCPDLKILTPEELLRTFVATRPPPAEAPSTEPEQPAASR